MPSNWILGLAFSYAICTNEASIRPGLLQYSLNTGLDWPTQSLFGRSFTVDVSEPKPNRPNTMNLVKKWAQELDLSEGFFNGLTGS